MQIVEQIKLYHLEMFHIVKLAVRESQNNSIHRQFEALSYVAYMSASPPQTRQPFGDHFGTLPCCLVADQRATEWKPVSSGQVEHLASTAEVRSGALSSSLSLQDPGH